MTATTDKSTSTATSDQSGRLDEVLIRIINATAGGQRYDVFVGDNKRLADIDYRSVTPYKRVSGTVHTLKVRPAGKEAVEPLAQSTEVMVGGQYYTAVLMSEKEGKGVKLNVYGENLVVPPIDKIKLRLINASPDVGEIGLYPKGREKALFDGVGFASADGYNEVRPIKGALEIRPKGKKNTLAMVPATRFDAGKLYTIVIAGRSPKLEAITVQEQLAGGATPGSSTEGK